MVAATQTLTCTPVLDTSEQELLMCQETLCNSQVTLSLAIVTSVNSISFPIPECIAFNHTALSEQDVSWVLSRAKLFGPFPPFQSVWTDCMGIFSSKGKNNKHIIYKLMIFVSWRCQWIPRRRKSLSVSFHKSECGISFMEMTATLYSESKPVFLTSSEITNQHVW